MSGLPVLVWIHGGGFTTSSLALPTCDGATFAYGVVCVSINYCLTYTDLVSSSSAPVSHGAHPDRRLDLGTREPRPFRRDPDHVTVAGESAGPVSGLALMSRDKGLIFEAIVQSRIAYLGQTPTART
ncbi:hypothetical protein NKH18_01815 [Streptomyces sp. M10(2022)]